jgi:hypothetical protein
VDGESVPVADGDAAAAAAAAAAAGAAAVEASEYCGDGEVQHATHKILWHAMFSGAKSVEIQGLS